MSFTSRQLSKKAFALLLLIAVASTQSPVAAQYNEAETQKAGALLSPDGSHFQFVKGTAVKRPPTFNADGCGNIQALDDKNEGIGTCLLKHTDVSVKVTGYVASVNVKQLFHNPYKKKIEAVYNFPLSDSAAVDQMKMRIGDRTINGTIKRKEEAQQIYAEARDQGYVASLLDQERPNVFTQRVANVEPNKDIEVNIHYVDQLPYESGFYTFAFPTVVGPRFHANNERGTVDHAGFSSREFSGTVTGGAFVRPTGGTIASRVNPVSYTTVSGNDLSMSIDIDAGLPVGQVFSPLYNVSINPLSNSKAHIELATARERPNRDFVLSWMVADNQIKSGYFTHRVGNSGYLSMAVMPPRRVTPQTAAPKEMIFVVDRSGSQSGAPLDKAKETMLYILDHMNPNDTFQIITFSDNTDKLFDRPRKATAEMRKTAISYIRRMQADGGTMMGPAIREVCKIPAADHRLRIVTFMTDGYVDNEMELLSMVKESRGNSRWFSFGTGNSVNRFLIDELAHIGGGEADYVYLESPAGQVGKKFYERISSPVLTDVKVTFDGIQVEDMFPRVQSDVWAERPLYINARYTKPGRGKIKIDGFALGKPYHQAFELNLPDKKEDNAAIAQLWARAAVQELMTLDWFGMQRGLNTNEKLSTIITELGLRYHIMTQFTSFVAVDSSFKTKGQSITVDVPAELPSGISLSRTISSIESAILTGENVSIETGEPTPTSTTQAVEPISAPARNGLQEFHTACLEAWQNAVSSPREFFPVGGWAGMINWLVASSRDANLFSGGESDTSSTSTESSAATPSFGDAFSSAGYASQPAAAPVSPAVQALAMRSKRRAAHSSLTPVPAPKAMSKSMSGGFVPPPPPVVPSVSTGLYGAPAGGGGSSYQMAQNYAGAAPALQGATNGSIGPQGGDATSIMGVNTAGTVRVNNLANLEAMLNIIANGLDILTVIIGLKAIIFGALGMRRGKPNAGKEIVFGFTWLAVWMFLAPILIPWAAWLLFNGFIKWLRGDAGARPALSPVRVESRIR